VSQPAADRMTPAWLATALGRLPDGVAVFDADWTVCYANPAAARLLGRPGEELAGRNLWIALPEVAGSVFHSFLLHARTVGTPVTWRGFYAAGGRWLSATAELVEDLLQVYVREADQHVEGPAQAGGGAPVAEADEAAADRERLRFLAEVSEAMITTLNRGESAAQLAQLAVPRLADWAIVALAGEDGAPGVEAWAHRDPALRADLDTYMRGRLRGTGDDAALVSALLSGEPVQVTAIHQ
jgi:sigma-B regulation protein RsbU (phosphoserine phosphatase)